MIIVALIMIYILGAYYLGYRWFITGGGESKFWRHLLFILSPMVVPFFLFIMIAFIGLGDED
jgi:hypothetical protein